MALKRHKSNIVNIGFGITNEDGKAGVLVDQTVLNHRSAVVSFRLVNGGRKSAAVKLDRAAVLDLAEAIREVLAIDGDF